MHFLPQISTLLTPSPPSGLAKSHFFNEVRSDDAAAWPSILYPGIPELPYSVFLFLWQLPSSNLLACLLILFTIFQYTSTSTYIYHLLTY